MEFTTQEAKDKAVEAAKEEVAAVEVSLQEAKDALAEAEAGEVVE